MNIKRHFFVYKGLPKDIYLLFIAVVVNKIGSFIAPLMTLILTVKVGFSAAEAGLFSTLSMVTQAPFIMLGGILADKFGCKRIIVIFQSIGALIYIVCGFMEPSLIFAILLVITSSMYALVSPAMNAMVPMITPAPLVKNAYSLIYLGMNLGLAMGPTIGGVLFNEHLNLLFFLSALATILSTGFILFLIRGTGSMNESRAKSAAEPDNHPDTDSIFSFLRRNPVLLVFSIIMLIYNFCYIQWDFLLPLQTVELFEESGPGVFSILLSTNAMIVIILTPILTSITQNAGPLKSIFVGGIFYFGSYLLFATHGYLIIFISAIIIMTIGEILISINSNNYIAKLTPQKYLGRATSILFLVNGLGFAIGPAVMGYLLRFASFTHAWLIVAAIMLVGASSMYLVRRLERVSTIESREDTTSEENVAVIKY